MSEENLTRIEKIELLSKGSIQTVFEYTPPSSTDWDLLRRWKKNLHNRQIYLQRLSDIITNNELIPEGFSINWYAANNYYIDRYCRLRRLYHETFKEFNDYIICHNAIPYLEAEFFLGCKRYTHNTTRLTPYIEIDLTKIKYTRTNHCKLKKRCRQKKKFYNKDSILNRQRTLLRSVKFARFIPNNFLYSINEYTFTPTMSCYGNGIGTEKNVLNYISKRPKMVMSIQYINLDFVISME